MTRLRKRFTTIRDQNKHLIDLDKEGEGMRLYVSATVGNDKLSAICLLNQFLRDQPDRWKSSHMTAAELFVFRAIQEIFGNLHKKRPPGADRAFRLTKPKGRPNDQWRRNWQLCMEIDRRLAQGDENWREVRDDLANREGLSEETLDEIRALGAERRAAGMKAKYDPPA